MKDLQIASGDLVLVGADFATVDGAPYIRQRIATALSEPYGSDAHQPTWGSTLWNYLGKPVTSGTAALVSTEVSRVLAALIASQQQMIKSWVLTGTRAQLAAADTIASVVSVSANQNPYSPDTISVTIVLITQGGQQLTVTRTVASEGTS